MGKTSGNTKKPSVLKSALRKTEILLDDAEIPYPHCILPKHFFEHALNRSTKGAGVSIERIAPRVSNA